MLALGLHHVGRPEGAPAVLERYGRRFRLLPGEHGGNLLLASLDVAGRARRCRGSRSRFGRSGSLVVLAKRAQLERLAGASGDAALLGGRAVVIASCCSPCRTASP
jgi:hypothetical protein